MIQSWNQLKRLIDIDLGHSALKNALGEFI